MNKYLQAIKNSDNKLLGEIYQKNYPQIQRFVLNNSGDESDAQDVFQDAMVSLYRRLQKEDITISATFGTYLYGICKFIWYKKIERTPSTNSIENIQIEDTHDIEASLTNEQKYGLFLQTINKLGEDCKKVLTYYFEKKSFKEIAVLMNYTGDEYARRKKFLCKKNLINKIKQDPLYKELYK